MVSVRPYIRTYKTLQSKCFGWCHKITAFRHFVTEANWMCRMFQNWTSNVVNWFTTSKGLGFRQKMVYFWKSANNSSQFRLSHMSNVITYDMDFYFCLPLYGQFHTSTGLIMKNYTTCRFLQSLLTIWMHISCFYDMSYHIIIPNVTLYQNLLNLAKSDIIESHDQSFFLFKASEYIFTSLHMINVEQEVF